MLRNQQKINNKSLDNRKDLPFRMGIDDFRTQAKTIT